MTNKNKRSITLEGVHVENMQNDLSISIENVQKIVQTVIVFAGEFCDEVGIHFVDIHKIGELHAEYFNDPSPTDCISFPLHHASDEVDDYRILGDVFICPKAAIDYAAAHRGDAYREMTLYVVHGLLHLMGYDDIEDIDRAVMRAAEKRHMQYLEQQDLLPHG